MSLHEMFTESISRKLQYIRTHERLTSGTYPTTISLLLDFLASRLAGQENVSDVRIPEASTFLRSLGLLGQNDHNICYLKTYQDYYLSETGRLCERSSPPSLTSGFASDMILLTLRIAPHKNGEGCSLLDILQPPEEVDEKYYVKQEALEGLILHAKKQKASGRGFGAVVQSVREKSNTVTTRNVTGGMHYIDISDTVSGRIDDLKQIGHFNKGGQGDRIYDPSGKSCTITSNGGGMGRKTGLYRVDNIDYSQGKIIDEIDDADNASDKHTGPELLGTIGEYGQGRRVFDGTEKSATLTAGDSKRQDKYAIPIITPNRKVKHQNGRRCKEKDDKSFTLTCHEQHGVIQLADGDEPIYENGMVVGYVDSDGDEHSLYNLNNHVDGHAIRRLTPLECERLQGFPQIQHGLSLRVKGTSWSIAYKNRFVYIGTSTKPPHTPKLTPKILPAHKTPTPETLPDPTQNDSDTPQTLPSSQSDRAPHHDVRIVYGGAVLKLYRDEKLLLSYNALKRHGKSPPVQHGDVALDTKNKVKSTPAPYGNTVRDAKAKGKSTPAPYDDTALDTNDEVKSPHTDYIIPRSIVSPDVTLRNTVMHLDTIRRYLHRTGVPFIQGTAIMQTGTQEKSAKKLVKKSAKNGSPPNKNQFNDAVNHIVDFIRRTTGLANPTVHIDITAGYTADQPDGARYKQIGNAVCVPVIEQILNQMEKHVFVK